VKSSQIANAKITVKGVGVVGEAQKSGFIKQVFGFFF